jgi:type IV pilus modification protein PilV
MKKTQSRPRGFSLIEVLVAMLVLAIGLLGLAALQTQGVRFNHDAFVRTTATNLAMDITDAMRAARTPDGSGGQFFLSANFPGRAAAPSGGYTAANPPYTCNERPAIPALSGSDDAATVSEAIADTALPCWLNAVEMGLPLGRATITVNGADPDPGDPTLFDVTLMWLDREPRDFGDDTRLPANAGECTTLPNRAWPADVGRCMVTQTWTVQP